MKGDLQKPSKLCFVTIGATAGFDALLLAVLSRPFLDALRDAAYTDLLVQYGSEGAPIFESFTQKQTEKELRIKIRGFDFNTKGLATEMSAASEGVILSHAGSGSILDGLRLGVPLIVVPNPRLLNDHQVELAEELAAQGYVVHGKLDDLPATIPKAEELRERQRNWPPANSSVDPSDRGLAGVMDEEMGFLD